MFGNQGDKWRKAVLSIGENKDFTIIIEATRGDNFQGDIAIDDISFADCFAGLLQYFMLWYLFVVFKN